jgi:isocitrate dehydrogenase kinase/phosphatase
LDEYLKIIKECEKIGIEYGDAHFENIGIGEFGQLVFFDVGVYTDFNYRKILNNLKVVRV